MVLRLVVFIGLVAFCVFEGLSAASVPSLEGRHYLPIVYILSPLLLLLGLGPKGVFTWPIVSVMLLYQGHWLVGWIPLLLVVFNIIGNEWVRKNDQQMDQEITSDLEVQIESEEGSLRNAKDIAMDMTNKIGLENDAK